MKTLNRMKKLILQKWVLLLTLFFIFSGHTFATNYVVSGAGSNEVNGTYVETGTWNSKPLYIFDNNGTNYAIGYAWGSWKIGRWFGSMGTEYYFIWSEAATPPLTGWQGGMMGMPPYPTLEIAGRTLTYSAALFTENAINDGSMANTIVITFNEYGGDAFTGIINDNFIADGKVTVNNVPSGLTASIIKTAGNQLTFSLSGNATNHAQTDKIGNITVIFQNSAFTQGNAAGVTNYSKSDIGILFKITFSGGAGTSDDPYLISNKTDLRILSENWSGVLWDKQFKQTADISFQDSDFQSGGDFYNSGEGWIPIGNMSANFTGIYNGNHHTIANLFIYRPDSFIQGLFGLIEGTNTKVENLGVINVNVTVNQDCGGLVGSNDKGNISNCYTTGTVTGTSNIGGLLGNNYRGNISNSHSSGNVTGTQTVGGLLGINSSGTITKSYSGGTVTGGGEVGGLVGNNNGSISNSYSTANVSGSGNKKGGLIGFAANPEISNSYSTGNVTGAADIGGFIGQIYVFLSGTIVNSYSTGAVSGSSATGGFVGSITGTSSITNSFWDTQTSGKSTSAGTATGKTTTQMKTQATFTGWDFVTPVWKIAENKNNGYPYLEWQIFTTTWHGSENNDWNTAANWDENAVPTTLRNVIIPDVTNQPVVTSGVGASCYNLTVNSGASLTINSGGSLITNGSITGSVVIERDVSDGQYHLISSPITNATANTFLGEYLQTWSEPTATWSNIEDPATSLVIAKGYSLWGIAKSDQTYTFTGTPNTGNQSIAITNTEVSGSGFDGANLLGNPYPSAIDWSYLDDTYGAVYYWNGSAYVSWNNDAGTGSQFIPPMQGFFIVTASNGTFNLTNTCRTHSGAAGFYKSGNGKTEGNGLILQASNGSYNDELYLLFDDEASPDFELTCDAWKFSSSTAGLSQLWSVCTEGNLSIDVRPETQTIQLGFANDQNGIYTIGINEIADISKATLEDTKTGTFHDLFKGAYEFVWDITDDETRFKLHLNTVGIEETPNLPGNLWITGNTLFISSPLLAGQSGLVEVYNASGQMLFTKSLVLNELTTQELNLKGFVIVKLTAGNEVMTTKGILN